MEFPKLGTLSSLPDNTLLHKRRVGIETLDIMLYSALKDLEIIIAGT